MSMSEEPNVENEMTSLTSDKDMAEAKNRPVQGDDADVSDTDTIALHHRESDNAETMPIGNGGDNNDAIETLPVTESFVILDDKSVDDGAAATETIEVANDAVSGLEADDSAGSAEKAEDESEHGPQTSSTPSNASSRSGYVPPSNFASGSAPYGTYVHVPRDFPQQMPKPQPPAGPSKATILLSLLPLFLGALTLFIGSIFPMVFASVPGGVDMRSLVAMGIVLLGVLLIVLAALLGLASLIHKGTSKRKGANRQ
ncbi:hypothetical protein OZX57_02605 [Bifidobacterium sp. ESL0682]|uniref:hypothetical protein n=1 Tax=Bifidobacterium sp. ESL0682 TaxID=2983212 RepID=UPI0023F77674|nr:hypothetical protein [Bifidobacterium sp. ESL0682]WEV42374.1 hypothetical protein OZX57_02605 [Bifidobacterium sp. ESL0682]